MKTNVVLFAIFFSFAILFSGCQQVAENGTGSRNPAKPNSGTNSGNTETSLESKVAGTYTNGNISFVFNSNKNGEKKSSLSLRAISNASFTWTVTSNSGSVYYATITQNGKNTSATFDTSKSPNTVTISGESGTFLKGGSIGGGGTSGGSTSSDGAAGGGGGSSSGGSSSGGGSSGGGTGGGGNTPPATDDTILCANHDWAYDYVGVKPNPFDSGNDWHYHRAFCKFCGYETTDWCNSTYGCNNCKRKSVKDNDSYDSSDSTAQFIPITENFNKIVIVANNGFANSEPLTKYISHKQQKGFKIVDKYYPTGKQAEEIRNELKTEYESTKNAGETMCVLIVGRGGNYHNYSIPEFVSKNKPVLEGKQRVGATDFYYGYYGNETTNLFPQVVVGRLSARNIPELQAQVDKIVKMETEPRTANKNIVLVQQKKNDGSTPFSDESREITEYVNNKLSGYNVATKYTNDTGSINSAISSGALLVSYSGHGGFDFWGDSRYNVNNIRGLQNSFYPIVLGVTCNSADFTYGDECVAEAFMRNANGGAVGYIGASTVMIAYYSKAATMGNDKIPGMVSSLLYSTSNNYGNNYKVETLGGMFLAALRRIKMSKTYSNNQTYKDYSIEILNLFGDPTYRPYTDMP